MYKNYFLFLFIAAVLVFFASSCSKPLPANGVPSYIRVDTLFLEPEVGEGTAFHNFSHFYCEVGDQDLGNYDYPKVFPVLVEEGDYQCVFSAGIKMNGLGNDRRINPFITPDITSLHLAPAETTLYKPVFSYKNATHFLFNENFEAGSIFDGLTRINDATKAFEGDGCGLMNVASGSSSTAYTINAYDIPVGVPNFIEMHYKSDVLIQAGIRTISSTEVYDIPKVSLYSNNQWKKVYIDFSSIVADYNTSTFKFYIRAIGNDSIPNGEVYIDNVKWLYLE